MSEEIKHFSCALSTVLGCVTSSLEHTEDPGTGKFMQFLRGKSVSKLLLVQSHGPISSLLFFNPCASWIPIRSWPNMRNPHFFKGDFSLHGTGAWPRTALPIAAPSAAEPRSWHGRPGRCKRARHLDHAAPRARVAILSLKLGDWSNENEEFKHIYLSSKNLQKLGFDWLTNNKATGWLGALVRVTSLKFWFLRVRGKMLVFAGVVKKCLQNGHSFRLAHVWLKSENLRFACAVTRFCSSRVKK